MPSSFIRPHSSAELQLVKRNGGLVNSGVGSGPVNVSTTLSFSLGQSEFINIIPIENL
jgi:hypothetical protein